VFVFPLSYLLFNILRICNVIVTVDGLFCLIAETIDNSDKLFVFKPEKYVQDITLVEKRRIIWIRFYSKLLLRHSVLPSPYVRVRVGYA
jgi:hypothetical protein